MTSSSGPGKDQGDIVGLLCGSDPVLHGGDHVFADSLQGQVAVPFNRFNQAVFTEFAKLVFRFSYAIAVGNKNITWTKVNGGFLVFNAVEQPNHGSTFRQALNRAILSQD